MKPTRNFHSERGSVLIVALIFAGILAIALTSYLKLSLNAGKLANRSFYMNAAQNLVDSGIEHALWSLNNEHLYPAPANWTTGGFAARSGYTNEYQGTFPSASTHYTFSGGVKGQVKVWTGVTNPSAAPEDFIWRTVAQATITLGDGTSFIKMAEAYLQQRSYSDRGMVARNGMSFNGAVVMDSWISRPSGPTSDVPYSTANRRANATVASPALINLQNADIYGYVSIGTSTITTAGIDVGPQGRVRGAFTGPGSGPGIDPARVTCDFTASFPDVNPASPGTASGAITGNTTLPGGTYTVPSINLSGNGADIHIGPSSAQNVILTVTGNVSLNGGAKIFIYPGSSLRMYVGGDVAMGGNSGVQNGTATAPNNPDCFTLLGLRTEADVVGAGGSWWQDWEVRGNGYLSCVIFAPNANVEVVGNGDTYGSLVGNRVDMVGTGAFHQDESLENNRISGLWKLLKWRELYTATDRAAFSSHLSF